MRRRAVIQGMIAAVPLRGLRLWAQTVTFPGSHEGTLQQLASTVLPASLGRAGTDAVAAQFIRWVREYRAGAEMAPGYGFPRVRYKPASPAPGYLLQLEELASGEFAQSDLTARRAQLARAFSAAEIKDLPTAPDGRHIAADLMSFYFQSGDATDVAYNAKIGRDNCRSLKNSGVVPTPWKGGAADAALRK